jgi:purine nucleosidase
MPRRRIHLDTDLGSDTDDLCALAMLLGWDEVDLIAVTTSTDPGGRRAGFTEYALGIAGRDDVPVCAGAAGSLAGLFAPLAFPDYWPEDIRPSPSSPGEATEVLEASAESGATIVAVGPFTNLALLEAARPGLLASTDVVVMGGHVTTPRDGLPQWSVHDDFNVQQDRWAAAVVFQRCAPTVVPLAVCLDVHLRAAHLEPLRASGALGKLIADQSEHHAADHRMGELGAAFSALPDDLMNFHYDPLACALAAGWDGVSVERIPTGLKLNDERLVMTEQEGAPELEVAVGVDGPRFEESWLQAVRRASSGAPE